MDKMYANPDRNGVIIIYCSKNGVLRSKVAEGFADLGQLSAATLDRFVARLAGAWWWVGRGWRGASGWMALAPGYFGAA